VDLYEYQARDMFESYGVPVLPGIIADTPAEARAAAEKLGGVVVVKAQVKVGGRGKAGGVKVAKTPDEAEAAAEAASRLLTIFLIVSALPDINDVAPVVNSLNYTKHSLTKVNSTAPQSTHPISQSRFRS
jgi:succinyl-CoA synthetase beta subunit